MPVKIPVRRMPPGTPTLSQMSEPAPNLISQLIGTVARGLRAEHVSQEDRAESPYAQYRQDPVRFVREVLGEEVPPDAERMMQAAVDHRVTEVKSANGTGKSWSLARLAVWFYLCYEDAKIYTFAAPPESNLRNILWGEIGGIADRHPELFEGHTVTDMLIRRNKQSFIIGVTIPMVGTPEQRKARFSGKHGPHMMFLGDEGDAVPFEVYEAIESCMSGGFCRALFCFNPRAQMGPLYMMEVDQRAHVLEMSAFNHPNVVTGEDIFPGAVDRETTVRRINEWSRPVRLGERMDEECFEVPEFLVGCTAKALSGHEYLPLEEGTRKITDSQFPTVVLGRYPAQSSGQLISRMDVMRAVARGKEYARKYGDTPPDGTQCVIGQDVGELGDDDSVCCRRYGSYVPPMSHWGGVDIDITYRKLKFICQDTDPVHVNVDGGGVGAGVWPRLHRDGYTVRRVMLGSKPRGRCELGKFEFLKDELWWRVREWLRTDPYAIIPDDRMLIEELCTPLYEKNLKGEIRVSDKDFFKEKLRRSPDRAEALMLSFYDTAHQPYTAPSTSTSLAEELNAPSSAVPHNTFQGDGEDSGAILLDDQGRLPPAESIRHLAGVAGRGYAGRGRGGGGGYGLT